MTTKSKELRYELAIMKNRWSSELITEIDKFQTYTGNFFLAKI
jgi:hypothetical protein